MTPEEFRQYGYKIIDWIADYRENLSDKRVMSDVEPAQISKQLPSSAPIEPESFEQVLSDLNRVILPGITHWNHPSFFAYFPSNATLVSVLGELLSAGLGVQGMSWQTSPAATELEEVVMDWLRQMIGLSESFVGVIQDTASTATLVALLCAREKSSNHSQNSAGLQGEDFPLVIYTSEQSHSSVTKAALLAGFGKNNLRLIDTDKNNSMQVESLISAIEKDLANGLNPSAIVATVGTTNTTAVDPIKEIAEIAKKYNIWLHIDAAMAGTAMILPECRHLWEGIEKADSILFNPHKWLGVAFDCTAYFVRDTQHLIRVMSTNPTYLQTNVDGQVNNFRDWGIQLGRRFRALKLWFLIREQGVSGLQTRIRRDLDNANWLKEQIKTNAEWEIVAPVLFQTICIRHIPNTNMDEQAIARHNLAWVKKINDSGKAYLTPSIVKGKQIVRISIGAEMTTRVEVENLWHLIQQVVKEC
jgi:aromatic-L-amino-acid/L-tryptophan decarboxylase